MSSTVANQGEAVRRARIGRGLTQSQLAQRAGISRQALGAIEAGTYQPGVSVALALARELGTSVETLFGARDGAQRHRVEALWDSSAPAVTGRTRMALARVGGKLIAVSQPAVHLGLTPAAGILTGTRRGHAEVETFFSPGEIDLTLLVGGCDPSTALLGDFFARNRSSVRMLALPLSSRSALVALRRGRVHVAGAHLRDPRTGEYNLESTRKLLAGKRTVLINFAQWELGLATAPGNPLGLRELADLSRGGLRIVNREVGSGARLFLDEAIASLDLKPERIPGYSTELGGHLDVATAVARGHADLGVTIRVAAEACGCGFIALREERYDLVMVEQEMDSEPLKAMLEVLNSRRFASEVSQMCLYDTQRMGQVVARLN